MVLGGGGRNGKSTICDLTLKVVGRFGVLASPALLTAKDSDHTTEITDLIGKRFALLEEFPRSNILNFSRLKRVVGTTEISGGRMRQDNQTWDATHTLVITTNHEIYIPAGDDGTWRRLVIINFPYPFVTEPTLPNDRLVELGLRDRLRAGEEGQHEAVLAWLVQGTFAKSLQNEYKASGIQIGKVRVNEFAKIPALTDDGMYTDAKLGFAKSQMIFDHLTSLGFLSGGEVTSKFIPDSIGFSLSLPENLDRYEAHVVELMRNASLEKFLKPKSKRKHRVLNKAVYLSAEFEEFWESISRRSTYRVSLNRDDLLGSVVTAMKSAPAIPPLRIEVTKAEIKVVRGGAKSEELASRSAILQGSYDLPDIVSELQNATSLTRWSIVDILVRSERLAEFIANPNDFISMAKRVIQAELAKVVVDGIQYEQIAGSFYELRELQKDGEEEKDRFLDQMYQVKNSGKSDFDYVVFDSDVERQFAEKLDSREDVKFFMKLPAKFRIPTPVGDDNPDWAIIKQVDGKDRLSMIRETKSSLDELKLRPTEAAKISSAREHFKSNWD